MGKRYFCDYCDKSFPDNAQNRKKHMSGIQHQKKVKTHYFNYKDPGEILAEETSKKPCRTFSQNGHCEFHPICKFSHLTPQWEKQLRREIEIKHQRAEARRLEKEQVRTAPPGEPTLEGWMSRKDKLSEKKEDKESTTESSSIFHLPEELQHLGDLPPSMIPPTLQDLVKAQDVDWG